MGPTADSLLGLFLGLSNANGGGLGIRLTCHWSHSQNTPNTGYYGYIGYYGFLHK